MSISAGTILGLIGLISSLASGGIGAGKSVKAKRKQDEVDQYNDKVESQKEKELKRQQADARRAAIARAIGGGIPSVPRFDNTKIKEPEPLDTTGLDVGQGIANVVGSTASMAGNYVDSKNAGGDISSSVDAAGKMPAAKAPNSKYDPLKYYDRYMTRSMDI